MALFTNSVLILIKEDCHVPQRLRSFSSPGLIFLLLMSMRLPSRLFWFAHLFLWASSFLLHKMRRLDLISDPSSSKLLWIYDCSLVSEVHSSMLSMNGKHFIYPASVGNGRFFQISELFMEQRFTGHPFQNSR